MDYLLVLIHLTLSMPAWTEYKQYNLSSVCEAPGEPVELYLGKQESIFSLGCHHKGIHGCHLRLRVFSEYFGQAVFIEKMRSDSCEADYLQFGRSSLLGLSYEKSSRYCENMEPPTDIFNLDGSLHNMDFGVTPYSRRTYVEETEDQMDVWISVSPQKDTDSECINFVVTPFKKLCMEFDGEYRQCPGSHSCVKRQLFCDGVVNCPHAWQESEETSCKFPHLRGGSFNNFPLTFFIVFVILSVGSILVLAWKVKWDNSEKRKVAVKEEHDRIEKLFKVKKKKAQDNPYSEASAPPFDSYLEEFYKFSKEQAEDCTRVECGE